MQIFHIKLSINHIILLLFIILNGCSQHQTIATSEAHLYNADFGIISNPELDSILEQELLTQNQPTEIDYSGLSDDPSLTTVMVHDPEAVTLENYVEPEPIITYKYMGSPKFYTEDELPENKFITNEALLP